jgi:hypothetical protein
MIREQYLEMQSMVLAVVNYVCKRCVSFGELNVIIVYIIFHLHIMYICLLMVHVVYCRIELTDTYCPHIIHSYILVYWHRCHNGYLQWQLKYCQFTQQIIHRFTLSPTLHILIM